MSAASIPVFHVIFPSELYMYLPSLTNFILVIFLKISLPQTHTHILVFILTMLK